VASESGILTSVSIRDPEACPVAAVSNETRVHSVSQQYSTTGTVPIEVTTEGALPADLAADLVFESDGSFVYQLGRPAGNGCPCESIADHGCPVRHVSAEGGEVVYDFIAPDLETVRSIIDELRSDGVPVVLRTLQRSNRDTDTDFDADTVVLDRGVLTDRQREVLLTAHRMGYFDRPRKANGREVAAELDVAPSTFAEHLAAAQSKLMDAVFERVELAE
jgi:hypothetical protein